jgi:D-3-phosphoglycerate dehydrogenase
MAKVLVVDRIHQAGLDLLGSQVDVELETAYQLTDGELIKRVSRCSALVVRSETQVTAEILEAGEQLQVVGRAGVGVDNIDLECATRRGIAVVNAPTGNTMAAAEHTIAMLLGLARNIPRADALMKRGEWKRGALMGVEVRGKTLGVIGLGRVGSKVAQRARGLEMRVVAFDPYVSHERASILGVELLSFDQVLGQSDFLTLHTPLTGHTRSLIGENELRRIKQGARLVNVARGGLIDEEALLTALESGHIEGVALDVFVEEPPGLTPLVAHPGVVATPHLGASTIEAQAEVAKEVVEQVLAVLRGHPAQYTVNAPFVPSELHGEVSPYLQVAADVGKIAVQMVVGQLSRISLRHRGDLVDSAGRALKAAALVGILQPLTDERVNLVNAELLAQQHGLLVADESPEFGSDQYANLITVEMGNGDGVVRVSGTYLHGRTHIVQIQEYWIDAVLETPFLLVIDHTDHPGLIGAVGGIAGKYDVNIASMAVGRREARGHAAMVLGLDNPMPEPALDEVRSIPFISSARVIQLNG